MLGSQKAEGDGWTGARARAARGGYARKSTHVTSPQTSLVLNYCTLTPTDSVLTGPAAPALYLVGGHISLQQGVLLLQVLDVRKVFAVIVRSQVTFHFVQPQFNVLHIAVKLLLLVSLAELYS